MAKIPAVVGIRISVAQVKAFTVSTPREGGVSITMKSYSPATGATASFSRCSFPVWDSSCSAPASMMFAGTTS